MVFLLSISSKLLIFIIQIYQNFIRLLIKPSCRFNPTCSQYGIEALSSFGTIKGSWLTIKRILKCHPLHPGGKDSISQVKFNIREK